MKRFIIALALIGLFIVLVLVSACSSGDGEAVDLLEDSKVDSLVKSLCRSN